MAGLVRIARAARPINPPGACSRRRAVSFALALAASLSFGCPSGEEEEDVVGETDDDDSPPRSPDTSTPTTPNPPPSSTTPKAGTLKGTIRDERGNPIAVPGVKYYVSISGVSEKSGERVSYNPPVKADGTYSATLVAGTYHSVSARIEITFNKSSYRFDLDPVQDNTADRESKDGIVQDFVWKLSGPHFRYAQNPNPSTFTNWYGGSVNVRLTGWRNDLNKGVEKPPVGTKYVFTFTPMSKLVDGSEGKVVTFERTYTDRGELDNGLLPSVPIGIYRFTGVEIAPGGAERGLIFETSYAKFEPQAVVDFPADEILHGPHVHQLSFDRQ